jgi:hypothetical protein
MTSEWPFCGEGPGGESDVVVAGTDGGGERKIASRRAPQFFVGLAWSPGGDLIALNVGNSSTGKSGVITIQAVSTGIKGGQFHRFGGSQDAPELLPTHTMA